MKEVLIEEVIVKALGLYFHIQEELNKGNKKLVIIEKNVIKEIIII
jgi:hypothetical protein